MLLLTKEEYNALEASFNRLATLASDGREKVSINAGGALFEASSQLITQFAESLSMSIPQYNKQGFTKVPTARKTLRMVNSWCKQQMHYLSTSIIPAYDDRVRKAETPEAKTRLRIYLTTAQTRVSLMHELFKKTQKELSK